MGLFDFVKKQFIDVIDWVEEEDGVIMQMYPMRDREIQSGAVLTVRESQAALFVNEGRMADAFGPGRHTLTTNTLPLLTNIKNWDKLFASPFKSDIFFFVTKQFIDRPWGTTQPITLKDPELGLLRLRAFGNYSFSLKDPKVFFSKITGAKEKYRVEELEGQLLGSIATVFATTVAKLNVPFSTMATQQVEISKALTKEISPLFADYGLALSGINLISVSLPEDVQSRMDKATSMKAVGDLNAYTQFQTAEAIGKAGGQGGTSNIGADLAAGLAMGQAMMNNIGQGGKGGGQDPVAMIEKLHDMMKKGMLTQAEFDTKKAELLKKIQS